MKGERIKIEGGKKQKVKGGRIKIEGGKMRR